MESKNFRATSMSDGFGQVLSIMPFLGRLGEEMSGPDGCVR